MQHGFIDLCILNCYFPNLYIFIIHNNVSLFYCGRPDGCPKHDERPVGAGVISYPWVSSRAGAATCCGSHCGWVFAPPASHPTRCHPPIPNDGELADSGCSCSWNDVLRGGRSWRRFYMTRGAVYCCCHSGRIGDDGSVSAAVKFM